MSPTEQDRRKAQRVNASLKLEVKVPRPDGPEETATLETLNISSSGVYFRSDHFIEPMTKLAMELEVAVPGSTPESDPDTALVPCEGLVVRINPEVIEDGCDSYEVAVFFTQVEPDGLANLEKHISYLMEDMD